MHEPRVKVREFWEAWLSEQDKSQARLRKYTLSIASAAKDAGQSNDLALLNELLDLYISGEDLFTDDPLLTTYELGKCHICLVVADSCYLADRAEQSFWLAQLVTDRLYSIDLRRVASNEPRLPNSELRTTAIGIMAGCFWEAPNVCSQDAMSGMVEEFWEVADQFWRNLDGDSVRQEMRLAMRHLIAIWELEVCKACLRLGTPFIEESIRLFNERHGQHIREGEPGCYVEQDSESQSAWFWEYEYAKLWLQGRAERQEELDWCAQMRLATARLTFGSQALNPLIRHWEARHRRHEVKALNHPASFPELH